MLSIDDMVLLRPLSVYFFSVRQPLTETQTRISTTATTRILFLSHLGSAAHNALTFSSYSALSLSLSLSLFPSLSFLLSLLNLIHLLSFTLSLCPSSLRLLCPIISSIWNGTRDLASTLLCPHYKVDKQTKGISRTSKSRSENNILVHILKKESWPLVLRPIL